jgi:hypothetical protein
LSSGLTVIAKALLRDLKFTLIVLGLEVLDKNLEYRVEKIRGDKNDRDSCRGNTA